MDDNAILEAFQTIRSGLSQVTPSSPTTPLSPATNEFFNCFDLLHEIGGYLSPGDQYRFLQVSKATHAAMVPLLYRHVRVKSPEEYAFIMPRELITLAAIAGGPPRTIPPHIKPSPLLDVYTRSIEIPIFRTVTLPLPNTTRIRTAIFKSGWAEPGMGRFVYESKSTFQGQRTVFRPPFKATDKHNRATILPARLPYLSTPDTVIQLNRLATSERYTCYNPFFYCGPPEYHPPSSHTCTILLFPFFWDDGLVWSQLPTFREVRGGTQFTRSLIDLIVMWALANTTHTFTIIGLEDANPFGPTRHWENRAARQTAVEKVLDHAFEYMVNNAHPALQEWLPQEKTELRERIRLMTFYDYLDTGEWTDDLDWRLVGRWLNAYDAREAAESAANEAAKRKRKRKREADDDGSQSAVGTQ